MELIPAIDIIEGKCVRLTQGSFDQKKVYSSNPLEVAQRFEGAGLRRLHLVDLDGARQKKVINLGVLELIASKTKLKIDFGGGVQSTEDLRQVFNAGAGQVTGGSIAYKNPELFSSWLSEFGGERIILGADVIKEKLAVAGWQEQTDQDLWEFIEKYHQQIRYVICTDVDKDGLLSGPSTDLYRKMVIKYPELVIIASGGVTSLDDLAELEASGVGGAIIGKAIYEGKITLKQLQNYQNAD
ncbi:MAG: 1-(5-phosphoribosyl)-5-[(5-phosphoribosylamino)methylideneamino]imidazole-4-carboxamide isomerase [Cyclobacteriaceae bacterium]|nr:1-(5-phosphoribosyl)-5-[(5-phosphoribosylamino)methylideneamino]imidazole-4-carboxamide isomerase [Cyclobacteriaceae bacterium]